MQSTLALRDAMAALLAADPDTLAPVADACEVALVMEDFNPTELLTIGDLTLATFDGSTPISAGTGVQPDGLDPNTRDGIITIKPPAGGWRFETTGVTNLPQTIYGFAFTDKDAVTLLGAEKFPEPIVLTAINQVIELPLVHFRQLANSLV